MKEEKVKCPICGTKNDTGAESCKLCKTHLSKKEDGSMKVKSPKSKGKTITIVDIEDPLTRKKLEELTLIPGVSRQKALLLYQSGIHSMEEFLQKAFHGEKLSVNYSRTVANKLLIRSLKKKNAKIDIPCPSCNAPNPMTAEKCNVCNFDIKKDMDSVNLPNLTEKISESVTGILSTLSESEDFDALPDDMKSQFASVIESDDIDFDMDKPKDYDSMGINLDEVDDSCTDAPLQSEEQQESTETDKNGAEVSERKEDAVKSKPASEKSDAGKKQDEPPVPNEEEPEKKGQPEARDAKKEKVRKVLTDKMIQWRKSGYDVSGLEAFLEDVEGFKVKAKEVLGQGKVVKNRYLKQLEMWREKGFDVAELEPLLETDVDAFADRAKEVLKKQKKK